MTGMPTEYDGVAEISSNTHHCPRRGSSIIRQIQRIGTSRLYLPVGHVHGNPPGSHGLRRLPIRIEFEVDVQNFLFFIMHELYIIDDTGIVNDSLTGAA